MNTIFGQQLSFLLSLAIIPVLGNGLSAQAETIDIGSTPAIASSTLAPVPGTTATSAAPLTRSESLTPKVAPAAQLAQYVEVNQRPATRVDSSYIGVGANIGLEGDTALGDGNFTIISRIKVIKSISVRPSVLIGDTFTFLIPVTYDISLRSGDAFQETLPLAPYLGAGVAITTGDNNDVGALISGGIDYSLTPEFTATVAVNAAFLDDTNVGLIVGVGYNFGGVQL